MLLHIYILGYGRIAWQHISIDAYKILSSILFVNKTYCKYNHCSVVLHCVRVSYQNVTLLKTLSHIVSLETCDQCDQPNRNQHLYICNCVHR